jgi:hypothetical protein
MKKQMKIDRKNLRANKEEIDYLLFVGIPFGILLILLNKLVRFGELF